jgi:NAD-dependent SIR2 family protein deacetylase
MGVDSGLPDFRGPEGFWRAYPPFEKLGLRFEELANPEWFERDPELAWGFYGHRLNLYRATAPHEGFAILRSWAEAKPHGAFVFTSNVDGHFQRAGFDAARIAECHGSLSHLQCLRGCGAEAFASDGIQIAVDPETFRAEGELPSCPECGRLARPNVLMFGDWSWDGSRSEAQMGRLSAWLAGIDGPLVVVELGAGNNVPTVRRFSESAARRRGATLIRVNPREPELDGARGLSLACGAVEALRAIDERL